MGWLTHMLRPSGPLKFVRNISKSIFVYGSRREIIGESTVVYTVPALQDNYMYVLVDRVAKLAFAVDPVEPDGVLDIVEKEKVSLAAVLTTHHHYDHSGGNEFMKEKIPDIPIYGGDERIDCMTNPVGHGDKFTIGSCDIECLLTPCHTSGHICYNVRNNGSQICFTGDTLFVAGCGRFFEGSAENMLNALNILSRLPPQTLVYCGHEYTIQNLNFAVDVEPSNIVAKEKLSWSLAKRVKNEPTVPSSIGAELKHNPFMRVHEPTVQNYVGCKNPVDVMAALRERKDCFRS